MGTGTYDFKWLLYFLISITLTMVIIIILQKTTKNDSQKESWLKLFSVLTLIVHISIYHHHMIVEGTSQTSLSTFFPIYPCNVVMFLMPIAFFFNGKIKEHLLTFLCYFAIYGGIITIFEPSAFYSGGDIFKWGSFKSFLSHSIMLLAGLYGLVSGIVKINIKNNLSFIMGLVFLFLPIGLLMNYLLNNNGYSVNAMYLIEPPLGSDLGFLNVYTISFLMVLVNTVFITFYEQFTLTKEERWYYRPFATINEKSFNQLK